jgi:hypothetical protein
MQCHATVGRVTPSVRRRTLMGCAAPIAAVVLFTACGSGGSTSTPPCSVSGVSVSANPATMNTGATSTLTATVAASAACAGGVTWNATPAGGTLTPSGSTATFTAATAGTYTIGATSTADATKSGSATVTVTPLTPTCGQPNGTIVTHAANITANESWAGDGVVHRVPNSIALSGSAVVTIQPCAIVALGQGVTISVGGTSRLVSAGTSAARFVSFRRDVASQAWGTLRGVSATSLIDLTWTTLTGGGNFGGMNDPTIAGFGNGYGAAPVAVVRVNNVTIQGSQGVGVYLDANAAFTGDAQQLTITGSGGRPINTTMMSLGSVPSGSYVGNATDEILITGPSPNVFADLTVEDRGVPVRIAYGAMSISPTGGATAPVTLTLKPGVVFKFPRLGQPLAPGARVTFGTNGNPPNNLVGILNAVGTAAKPIVFTSGEATPAPGDWVGLWLNTANGSRLDFVEISYAGAPSGIVSNNCRLANTPDNAALLVGDFSTQYVPPSNLITNSRITNSAGYGINAMWQAGALNSPDLTASNTFASNARCKQTYNALTPPGTCPVGGGCTAP